MSRVFLHPPFCSNHIAHFNTAAFEHVAHSALTFFFLAFHSKEWARDTVPSGVVWSIGCRFTESGHAPAHAIPYHCCGVPQPIPIPLLSTHVS